MLQEREEEEDLERVALEGAEEDDDEEQQPAEAPDRKEFETATFSGLFLSGQFSFMLDDDEMPQEELEDDVALQYFPDPPFVQVPDELPDEDPLDSQRPKPIDYWKDHAHYYDVWPSVKENRESNMDLVAALGSSRGRTSSVLNRRLVVNISPHQVGLRSGPSFEEESRTGEVCKSGRAVVASSCMTKDGVVWWKLREADAYVFEAKDGMRVMQEAMNVETGKWWYRVACKDCIEVRSAPDYGDELRTGWILSPRSLVLCNLRCRVGSSQWLLMEDGRGWIFVWKPVLAMSGGMKAGPQIALEESNHDFMDLESHEDVRMAIPATDAVVEVGVWNYVVQKRPILCIGTRQYGTWLSPGDIVKVDKRCSANGNMHRNELIQERVWLRLMDGRGWVPVHADDGLEQIVLQDPDDLTYPGWYLGSKPLEDHKHAWMVGFC